jgi:predicted RNA-binding protein with PUA-like domain
MAYWLFKSEPDVFSIDDLLAAPKMTTFWEGVRNYQARNFLRDAIKKGDGVLFYHSNAEPTAVVGTAHVVREGYPDPAQFDKKNEYYDAAAKVDAPRWFGVDIKADRKFAKPVTLQEIKATSVLKNMVLVQRGARLSVQPVTADAWRRILAMGGLK